MAYSPISEKLDGFMINADDQLPNHRMTFCYLLADLRSTANFFILKGLLPESRRGLESPMHINVNINFLN